MNNKAQIADTLTWIVALSITVFIIAAFIVGVVILIPQSGENKLDFELSKAQPLSQIDNFLNVQYIDLSNPKPEFVSSFLDKNSQVIFDWADSPAFFTYSEYMEVVGKGKKGINPEAEKIYNDVFNAYTELIKDYSFSEPYFYIRNGNKEIIMQKDSSNEFDWTINGQQGAFIHIFRTDKASVSSDYEYISKNKFFLVSDKGTLIMIIFYDKNEIKNEVLK
jgi:hypothetical protein